MNNYIKPNWPSPKSVKAFSTTRIGGVSNPPYDSFNLGLAAGDNPNNVSENRKKLSQELNLPQEPFWLKQEHTNIAIQLTKETKPSKIVADASFTKKYGPVCAVLTADCVPILVCDKKGTLVSAIHAGWKGIANGVIESSIKKMAIDPKNLIAWLGPAIGPNALEVKEDVKKIFCDQSKESEIAFVEHKDGFLANAYILASQRLKKSGVTEIYGGEYCTSTQKDLFFSFRRDGKNSGRMASIIWLEK